MLVLSFGLVDYEMGLLDALVVSCLAQQLLYLYIIRGREIKGGNTVAGEGIRCIYAGR